MIAAGLFGQLAPARYTVTTQVLVDPNDLRVVDNVLRGQNQFSDTHIAQVENQVRVLVSNNVLRRVVDRLKLDQDPEFVGSGTSSSTSGVRSGRCSAANRRAGTIPR